MIPPNPPVSSAVDPQVNSTHRRLLMAAGAVLSALLAYLSFPPADIGLLAWFALVPLLYGLGLARRPGEGFWVGLLYGAVFFASLMHYIAMFGVLPLVLLALFQGLFFAIIGWLVTYLRPVRSLLLRAGATAAIWVLMEYVRSHVGSLALTLGDLAYSQHSMLSVLQIASVLGAGAVTFLVVFANAVLAGTLLQSQLHRPTPRAAGKPESLTKPLVAGYAIVLFCILGGAVAIQTQYFVFPHIKEVPGTKGIHVAAVQGNVTMHQPPTEADADQCRWVYTSLSGRLPQATHLAVWPETALPVPLNRRPSYLGAVQRAARDAGAYLLVGALEEGETGELYNAAYLFSPTGELESKYHKVDLVLFGEYVPRIPLLGGLIKRYPIRSYDFTAGTGRRVMSTDKATFGALICFEAIFSAPSAELCRKGAQFLAFITSDSWAAGSAELLQHAATAPLRAVEARRFVVRAATMGPSMIINPYGRLLDKTETETAGYAAHEIYAIPKLSIYHRLGDLPLIAICLLLWVAAILLRRPRVGSGDQPVSHTDP